MEMPPRAFVLRLVAERGVADPIRSLRALLKVALRRYGLRCVAIEEKRKEACHDCHVR